MKRPTLALSMTAILAATMLAASAAAARSLPDTITLPGATSAEGVATGAGTTFYAGDLFKGDIFRGDLRTGSASRFIDAPDGRFAVGLKADVADNLLVVAGGPTGQGYVYNLTTGADVAVLQLADPASGPFINDVIVAGGAAWFTDSTHPHLFRVPIGDDGSVGSPSTLTLTGPAADLTGAFNLNGIAATPDGATLIVADSGDGALDTVDPATGASSTIAGANVPNVDGIVFEAGRIWAVRNNDNRVDVFQPSPDLSSATRVATITDPAFETPTTAGRFGNELAVVNAKFDTGFPPTATSFEVVIVPAR